MFTITVKDVEMDLNIDFAAVERGVDTFTISNFDSTKTGDATTSIHKFLYDIKEVTNVVSGNIEKDLSNNTLEEKVEILKDLLANATKDIDDDYDTVFVSFVSNFPEDLGLEPIVSKIQLGTGDELKDAFEVLDTSAMLAAIAEADDTRTYTISGWNQNEDGSGKNAPINSTRKINSDLTVYAQWESVEKTQTPSTVTITWYPNIIDEETPITMTGTVGDTINEIMTSDDNITAYNEVLNGFDAYTSGDTTVAGFYESPAEPDVILPDTTNVTDDITLYTSWS